MSEVLVAGFRVQVFKSIEPEKYERRVAMAGLVADM
jgi:hypothetical protein